MHAPLVSPTTSPDADADSIEIAVEHRPAWVFRRLRDGVRADVYSVKGRLQNGQQFLRCTHESSRREAVRVGRALFAAALKGRRDVLASWSKRALPTVATIGELIEAFESNYSRHNVKLRAGTAKGYVEALRRVVAWARGLHTERENAQRRTVDESAVDALPASVLTSELAREFEFECVSAAGKSPVDREAALRTACSALRNAKSMFGRRVMGCYAKLSLPELAGFLGAQTTKPDDAPIRDLPDATVAEIARAALALRKSDPDLYVVHVLARHAGMRGRELACARVGWLRRLEAPVGVTLPGGEVRTIVAEVSIVKTHDFDPKRTGGVVSLSPCVWAEIEAFVSGRAGNDYLVEPQTVNRHALKLVYERHADFLRPWLAEFAKKGHELRGWAATKIALMHESDEKAEQFLRHAKRSTAQRSYLKRAARVAPITLGDCGL